MHATTYYTGPAPTDLPGVSGAIAVPFANGEATLAGKAEARGMASVASVLKYPLPLQDALTPCPVMWHGTALARNMSAGLLTSMIHAIL